MRDYGTDPDTMKNFFSGKLKEEIDFINKKLEYDNTGLLIEMKGKEHGSYQLFSAIQNEEKNTFKTLLTDVTTDTSINVDTTNIKTKTIFKIGEIPKLLITYQNIMNAKELLINWNYSPISNRPYEKSTEYRKIYTGFYIIPPARDSGYHWFEQYAIEFNGPIIEAKGTYNIEINEKDLLLKADDKNKKYEDFVKKGTVEFTVN